MKSQTALGYLRASSNLRMVCRQAIPEGYCLIVEDDLAIGTMIGKVMGHNGIDARVVTTVDDAIGVLHIDHDLIICAIIDSDGEDVVREIEHQYQQIPYVFYTQNQKEARRISEHFPKANILMKGDDFGNLITALGLKVSA